MVDQELMPKFVYPEDTDSINTLIIESTYGANEKGDAYDYASEIQRLGSDIAAVIDAGGTVLVPAFAVGCTIATMAVALSTPSRLGVT